MAGAFGGAVPGTGMTSHTGPLVQSGPATLNSAINREWETFTTDRVRHTDTSSVTAIEPDGANGFNVTFNIDGVEHRVHMAASDYNTNSESYQQRENPGFDLWFQTGSFGGSSEYSHFNVNGWSVCTHGTDPNACSPQTLGDLRVVRGFVVHGDATENLPQGAADYSGRFGGDAYQSDDPNSSTSRARFRGDMTLTADFDNRKRQWPLPRYGGEGA